MNSGFLIFTIVILAVSVIIGIRKGILGALFGVISWILVVGIIYLGTPMVEENLRNGPVYEKFYNAIYDHIISSMVSMENELETTSEMAEGALDLTISDPESVGKLFDEIQMVLPWLMMRKISDEANVNEVSKIEIPEGTDEESIDARLEAVGKINATIADTAATPIASMMVRGVSVLFVLILAMLVTRIIGLILNALNDSPVIGGSSRVIGGLWGLLCGLLIVWVAMDLVLCFSVTPRGQTFLTEINANPFLNALFVYNPLEFLVK